ncbi:Calx-beta domain-containing protein [Kribbella sp. NPDC056951]|uniref:Calx-beta domain-containing protein n=1 Tax=Kribbella sp. NPDC056951 TaxID=3345978 RepID=UPI003637BCBA
MKYRTLAVAAAVLATTLGVPAGAAAAPPTGSVDPATVELTLSPGQSAAIAAHATTPTVLPRPDIVILGDTTGGMDPAVANVRNNIDTIIDRVRASQPTARFGVAGYKEQVDGDKVFTVFTPLTDDLAQVRAGMDTMSRDVFGGGAPWTDFVNAQFRIANGDAGAWRPNGSRVILWFGDAASHDPSIGHTTADAAARLQAVNARIVAVPVVGTSGNGLDALGQATQLVSATAGRLMANSAADQVTDALLAGLENLSVAVAPKVTCDAGVSAGFDTASRTVPSGTAVDFGETFAVGATTAPGNYHCTVDYAVNGVPAGLAQSVTIHVPGLSVADVALDEGDTGTKSATFTVTLDRPASTAVTVHAATADGTATAPSDYTATSVDLTFAPGEVTKQVTVPVVGDTTQEPDETFTLNLTGAAITDAQAVGTIRNDDATSAVPALSVNDTTVTEGNTSTTPATFTVSLDRPATTAVTVHAATADGTATAPGDFTATGVDLTFAVGEQTKQVVVPVVGDIAREADETFTLQLSAAAGATLADAQGVGTIRNDDSGEPLPRLRVDDVSVSEGDQGTVTALFRISVDDFGPAPVSGRVTTADGTATSPADFTATGADFTIPLGQVSTLVGVPVVGDTVDESDETFSLTVTEIHNAEVVDGAGVGTILDDDEPVVVPAVSVNDATAAEGDPATFTVSLHQATTVPVSVHVATANGTATAGADYASTSADLVFQPGQRTLPFTVAGVEDTADEPDETYAVRLSAASGATIADGNGVGTVTDDDRNGVFSCRAAAVNLLGNEPVVANRPGTPCVDASQTVAGSTLGSGLLAVRLGGGRVRTDQTPDALTAPPSANDTALAAADLATTRISTLGVTIELGAITSRATARCVPSGGGLVPSYGGSSTIASLRVNGLPIPIGTGPVTIPLVIGSLELNATTTTPTSVTQRAVRLHTIFGDVTLGETRAGTQGNPCATR